MIRVDEAETRLCYIDQWPWHRLGLWANKRGLETELNLCIHKEHEQRQLMQSITATDNTGSHGSGSARQFRNSYLLSNALPR